MFQNKSYSQELTSLHAPVHEYVRTLAYFSLHSGGQCYVWEKLIVFQHAYANAKALLNLSTCDVNTLFYIRQIFIFF
jgi:hypothetical protein